MKKLLIYAMIAGFVSCNGREDIDCVVVDIQDFPELIAELDTSFSLGNDHPLVIGQAEKVQEGYMFYLYDNDYFIALANDSLKLMHYVARKGSGPGELSGVSGCFGQPIDSLGSEVSIFDPYKSTLYALNVESGDLIESLSLPSEATRYSPFDVMRLKNGLYVSPRGDFKYGMIAFDPDRNEVNEWPIGLEEIDIYRPVENHVSLRAYDYNEKNGVIAEIYGVLPTIVVHDESGEIIKTITIKGLQNSSDENRDCFRDVCMTDDYILVLSGDLSVDSFSRILVLGYNGESIASCLIKPAQSISLDIENGRILAVNPNMEDENVIIYKSIVKL